MKIIEINEYNKDAKETVVKVTDGVYTVECFSQPCTLETGIEWADPLECLNFCHDIDGIYVDDSEEKLSKIGFFSYEIVGKLADHDEGIVTVGNLRFHIEANRIPKDIQEGQRIRFTADRIDIY